MGFLWGLLGKRVENQGPPDAPTVLRRVFVQSRQIVHGLATPPPDVLARLVEAWSPEERARFSQDLKDRSAPDLIFLKETGLWDDMTTAERAFIRAPAPKMQEIMNATWLMESAVCLLWALGRVAEMPPYDTQADPELLKVLSSEPFNDQLANAELRQLPSIQQAREFAERWHWRSRTRQLQESDQPITLPGKLTLDEIIRMSAEDTAQEGGFPQPLGGDFPAFGKSYRDLSPDEWSLTTSIATERHRALNWLCGYAPGNRWDKTPTDT
jgi:hypothetical protein